MANVLQFLQQLFTTGSVSGEKSATMGRTVFKSFSKTFGANTTDDWGNSSGSASNSSQSISTRVFNGNLKGQGSGRIGKLSGSTFVELARDLDLLAPPVPVKVKLTVSSGEVKMSIRTAGGEIVSATATLEPAEIAGTSEVRLGALQLKLEAVAGEASDINYQAEIG